MALPMEKWKIIIELSEQEQGDLYQFLTRSIDQDSGEEPAWGLLNRIRGLLPKPRS